jgi:hypothetical protein
MNRAELIAHFNELDFRKDDCLRHLVPSDLRKMMQLINEQHDLMKGIYRITSQIAGDSTQESMWIALAEITAALEHARVAANGKEGE